MGKGKKKQGTQKDRGRTNNRRAAYRPRPETVDVESDSGDGSEPAEMDSTCTICGHKMEVGQERMRHLPCHKICGARCRSAMSYAGQEDPNAKKKLQKIRKSDPAKFISLMKPLVSGGGKTGRLSIKHKSLLRQNFEDLTRSKK